MTRTHNQPEFTVSEISAKLKSTVEQAFSYVRVRGEISGLKIAASGHVYFSLKDENAVLNGICWKGVASKLQFRPEDGLEVICVGKISTYPGRSNYQIICDWVEPAGVGALMALLEKRKKELAAEGLFDESRKKPIPFLPQVIGVVTSPTGAVIRDILHRLSDRFPRHVLVWPVLVQGEGAAEQIAAAIKGFNQLSLSSSGLTRGSIEKNPPITRPDVLIIARGGGSLEDLWAFNEEIVVRAVANSEIPLISAVGHETDTTLIDLVADWRSPTPTAAAEKAVPVREELRAFTLDLHQRLFTAITRDLENKQQYLSALIRGLTSPKQLLETMIQRLDDWSERLGSSLKLFVQSKQHELTLITARLQPTQLTRQIENYEEKLASLSRLLDSCNYKKVLERGFVLVTDEKDKLISKSSQVKSNMLLNLEFADGRKTAISGTSPAAPKKPLKKKKTPEDSSSQGNLF